MKELIYHVVKCLLFFKLVWGLMRVVRDEYGNSCPSLFSVAMRKFCILEYVRLFLLSYEKNFFIMGALNYALMDYINLWATLYD